MDHHAGPEINARLCATQGSWGRIAKFCLGNAAVKMRKIVYMATVYSLGVIAMEVWVLRPSQAQQLQALLLKHCGAMHRGGTFIIETGKICALSDTHRS